MRDKVEKWYKLHEVGDRGLFGDNGEFGEVGSAYEIVK